MNYFCVLLNYIFDDQKKGAASSRPRSKPASGGGIGILPPPPSGIKIAAPTGNKPLISTDPAASNGSTVKPTQQSTQGKSADDLLLDLDSLNIGSSNTNKSGSNTTAFSNSNDLWSDFESINTSNAAKTQSEVASNPWTQF